MRTTMAVALLLTLLGVGAAERPVAPAPASTPSTTAEITLTGASLSPKRKERRIIRLTNRRRAAKGCAPVRLRTPVLRAARRHSRVMARHETMSHQLPGEHSLGDRATRAGYTGWTRLAENIAYGYRSPRALVRAWMRSPGHRRNILNCRYRHIGVGLVWRDGVPWWTQNFGRR